MISAVASMHVARGNGLSRAEAIEAVLTGVDDSAPAALWGRYALGQDAPDSLTIVDAASGAPVANVYPASRAMRVKTVTGATRAFTRATLGALPGWLAANR